MGLAKECIRKGGAHFLLGTPANSNFSKQAPEVKGREAIFEKR